MNIKKIVVALSLTVLSLAVCGTGYAVNCQECSGQTPPVSHPGTPEVCDKCGTNDTITRTLGSCGGNVPGADCPTKKYFTKLELVKTQTQVSPTDKLLCDSQYDHDLNVVEGIYNACRAAAPVGCAAACAANPAVVTPASYAACVAACTLIELLVCETYYRDQKELLLCNRDKCIFDCTTAANYTVVSEGNGCI
jgi:hypothetical protein